MESEEFFIVSKKALPEVLLKVVEAKRMLDSEKAMTVQEATEAVGLSRSSFYKYKDDVLPFHENARGKTLNLMLQVDDETGILSSILAEIAGGGANILTIQQSIPIGGVASIALGFEILPETEEVNVLLARIRGIKGVHYIKILGRE